MKIEFFDEQKKVPVTQALKQAVKDALSGVQKEEGVDFCANILFTDNDGIRVLNKDFRRMDKATDVLSFPAYELEGPLKDCLDHVEAEKEDGRVFAGDIAISLERAREQAGEYGHSLTRETAFLAVHGALHLLGYDHMDTAGEAAMTEKQRGILDMAGIPRE